MIYLQHLHTDTYANYTVVYISALCPESGCLRMYVQSNLGTKHALENSNYLNMLVASPRTLAF